MPFSRVLLCFWAESSSSSFIALQFVPHHTPHTTRPHTSVCCVLFMVRRRKSSSAWNRNYAEVKSYREWKFHYCSLSTATRNDLMCCYFDFSHCTNEISFHAWNFGAAYHRVVNTSKRWVRYMFDNTNTNSNLCNLEQFLQLFSRREYKMTSTDELDMKIIESTSNEEHETLSKEGK